MAISDCSSRTSQGWSGITPKKCDKYEIASVSRELDSERYSNLVKVTKPFSYLNINLLRYSGSGPKSRNLTFYFCLKLIRRGARVFFVSMIDISSM